MGRVIDRVPCTVRQFPIAHPSEALHHDFDVFERLLNAGALCANIP